MKRYAALLCVGVVLSVVVLKAPAAWLTPLIKHYSQGAVTVTQSWGTVWHGSALLRLHRSEKEVLNVPQAVVWTLDLSRIFELSIHASLSSAALQAPVKLAVQGSTLRVGAGRYALPADTLNTFGAPFNTLKPSGNIALQWGSFVLDTRANTAPAVALVVTIDQLRMALTGAQVLGNYTLSANPMDTQRYALALRTDSTAPVDLALSGQGSVDLKGKVQFELRSKAASPQAQGRVQTLLNFLGRRQGDEYVLNVN